MGPKFKSKLEREIRLRLREMRDGCNDCRSVKGFCNLHGKEAMDIITNPKKFINLDTTKENK